MAHLAVILQPDRPDLGFAAETVNWPLHVTVMPAFTTEVGPEQVVQQVFEIVRQSGPLVMSGAAIEYFGPAADIPVTVLNAPTELGDLHDRVLSSGAGFRPTFRRTRARATARTSPPATARPSGSAMSFTCTGAPSSTWTVGRRSLPQRPLINPSDPRARPHPTAGVTPTERSLSISRSFPSCRTLRRLRP